MSRHPTTPAPLWEHECCRTNGEHQKWCGFHPSKQTKPAPTFTLDQLRDIERGQRERAEMTRLGVRINYSAEAHDQLADVAAYAASIAADYHELIFAVESKFPFETRHETALKYIRRCEQVSEGLSQNASAKPTEAP
jgi:hypothetical protein